MRSANNGSNQEVITPSLVMASTSAAPPSAERVEPVLGAAAPGDAPELDQASLEKLIKERVDMAVEDKLRALEADDPDKLKLLEEDQQFSNFDQKLQIFGADPKEALPGFHLHWFNDDGDRVLRMQAMGYTFVKRTEVAVNDRVAPLNQDLGENIAIYVGKRTDGAPMRALLMKIPQELYERRYKKQQEHNDVIEDAIKRGGIGNALSARGYAGTDRGAITIGYNPRGNQVVSRDHKPS
jgi:hypothetical protein